jgi:hypothetical protein
MGRMRVVCFHIQSSEGGSPGLCRFRTDRLAPVNKIDYVLMHMRFWGPANLVASTVTELNDTLPCFTDVQGIVFEPPIDYPLRFLRGRQH